MTLQEVKQQIENKSIINTFIIFRCDENFIAHQYTTQIKNILGLKFEYIENLDSLCSNSMDIFFTESVSNGTLRVHHCDNFDYYDKALLNEDRLIIICKKIDKSTAEIYKDYIVDIDPLEHWCIKDYLYSILEGVDHKYIDWLMANCNYNINRLQLEAEKLLIFEENERNIVIRQMIDEDAFSDISSKTIFDFTEALIKKDLQKMVTIYQEIDNMDVEPLGVVTILYKNFIKYLSVWYSRTPTPENTGLSSKQIWAINKLPHIWSEKQLVDIIEMLTSIDFKIKNGEMPMNILRDYMVVDILSR